MTCVAGFICRSCNLFEWGWNGLFSFLEVRWETNPLTVFCRRILLPCDWVSILVSSSISVHLALFSFFDCNIAIIICTSILPKLSKESLLAPRVIYFSAFSATFTVSCSSNNAGHFLNIVPLLAYSIFILLLNEFRKCRFTQALILPLLVSMSQASCLVVFLCPHRLKAFQY